MTPAEFKNVQLDELCKKRFAEIDRSISLFVRSLIRQDNTPEQKVEDIKSYVEKKEKEYKEFVNSLEWEDE